MLWMWGLASDGVQLASSSQTWHVSVVYHRTQVVWQSAFVLAEYLLRAPPYQTWEDVRVVDLGTGTGEALLTP